MKNLFLAIVNQEDDKFYAHGWKFNTYQNLLNLYKQFPSATIIHICDTKKQMQETVDAWNKTYKENGTYLFDSPSF